MSAVLSHSSSGAIDIERRLLREIHHLEVCQEGGRKAGAHVQCSTDEERPAPGPPRPQVRRMLEGVRVERLWKGGSER